MILGAKWSLFSDPITFNIPLEQACTSSSWVGLAKPLCVCVCGKVSDTLDISTCHVQWRGGGVSIGWGNSKWSTGEEGGGGNL